MAPGFVCQAEHFSEGRVRVKGTKRLRAKSSAATNRVLTRKTIRAYHCSRPSLTTWSNFMVKRATPARDEDLEQLANLLRLLSDKTRLNILLMLTGGERNVSNLCEALKLPQPTVSHHLGLLRMSNVINGRRDGKQVFYGLDGRVQADSHSLELASGAFTISIS